MSLCDRCYAPGMCCRFFNLQNSELYRPQTNLEAMVALSMINTQDPQWPMPFQPLFRRQNGGWTWWCSNLQPNGRCGDYDGRPATCRIFEPRDDSLCIHFAGAEGVDMSNADGVSRDLDLDEDISDAWGEFVRLVDIPKASMTW